MGAGSTCCGCRRCCKKLPSCAATGAFPGSCAAGGARLFSTRDPLATSNARSAFAQRSSSSRLRTPRRRTNGVVRLARQRSGARWERLRFPCRISATGECWPARNGGPEGRPRTATRTSRRSPKPCRRGTRPQSIPPPLHPFSAPHRVCSVTNNTACCGTSSTLRP